MKLSSSNKELARRVYEACKKSIKELSKARGDGEFVSKLGFISLIWEGLDDNVAKEIEKLSYELSKQGYDLEWKEHRAEFISRLERNAQFIKKEIL